jgi:hypothetical protein
MTPEQIAIELVNKYIPLTLRLVEEVDWVEDIDSAKDCALISVNEFLDFLSKSQYDYVNTIAHWQQVKKEIQNL